MEVKIKMLEEKLNNIKEKYFNSSSKKGMLIKVGIALLILLFVAGIRINNSRQDDILVDESASADSVIETNMYVDISGEVNKPGVYQFESGTRLYEVIDKAGGLTEHADKNGINQAEFVEDGQKIVIPTLNSGGSAGTVMNSSGGESANGLVNINTASKDQLMGITGVGEVIAERIIEYRETNKFKSIEDIQNVKGIGSATYEKMKSEITV